MRLMDENSFWHVLMAGLADKKVFTDEDNKVDEKYTVLTPRVSLWFFNKGGLGGKEQQVLRWVTYNEGRPDEVFENASPGKQEFLWVMNVVEKEWRGRKWACMNLVTGNS